MTNQHIVLFPFMAQGHLIPFLALAKFISQRHPDYGITLVNTPLNIKKLQPSLPPNSSIRLAELSFSHSDHGLPPNIETTEYLPIHRFIDFFHATETLQPSFESLMLELILEHGHDNLCIIADMFLGWTVESANKLGVFHSVFVTSGAYGSAIFFSLWLNPPKNFEEDEIALADFPEIRLHRSVITKTVILTDGADPTIPFIQRMLSLSFRSSSLLVNTAEEFEKEGLSLLRRSPGLHVWSIGPIVNLPSPMSIHANNNCITWLNSKPPASVLYISFGSQNSIPASQMMQLAKSLEASGKYFIWALRPPLESHANEEFRSQWLPEGFEDRMRRRNQGMLVLKWAPQLEILSHGSTSSFLSHCGWNSVVESLSQGVPIIGWPLIGDQVCNCKMLEEMGVCIEIANGMQACDGLNSGWQGTAKTIELVMGGSKKANEMRIKAKEIKDTMMKALNEDKGIAGSSIRAMEEFLQTAFSVKNMAN